MTHSTFHFYLLVFAAVLVVAIVNRWLRRRRQHRSPATTISPRALAVATRLNVKRWGKERKKGNPGLGKSKWSKA